MQPPPRCDAQLKQTKMAKGGKTQTLPALTGEEEATRSAAALAAGADVLRVMDVTLHTTAVRSRSSSTLGTPFYEDFGITP
jgi:hypothetical protein